MYSLIFVFLNQNSIFFISTYSINHKRNTIIFQTEIEYLFQSEFSYYKMKLFQMYLTLYTIILSQKSMLTTSNYTCKSKSILSKHQIRFYQLSDIKFSCDIKLNSGFVILLPIYHIIFDKTIDFYNLTINKLFSFEIYNFNGFKLGMDLFSNVHLCLKCKNKIELSSTKFDFYIDEKIVNSNCDLLDKINYNGVFFTKIKINSLNLNFNVIFSKYCPLIFNNLKVDFFQLKYLSDTFVKRNILKFVDYNHSKSINTDITSISLVGFYIKIDKDFLNKKVFYPVKIIAFHEIISFIDKETFSGLFNLKRVILNLLNLRKFMYTSYEWISNLNNQIHRPSSIPFKDFLSQNIENVFYLIFHIQGSFFIDEDLCLLKNFPHDNLVYPIVNYQKLVNCNDVRCICVLVWILKNTNYYSEYFNLKNEYSYDQILDLSIDHLFINFNFNFSEYDLTCQFNETFNKCFNKSISSIDSLYSNYYEYRYLIGEGINIFEYVTQIILYPLFCLIGLIMNIVAIRSLKNKRKEKDLSGNLFKYAFLNFVFNLINCTIMPLKLMNKCIVPGGIYCSWISNYVFVQYIEIYVIRYFGSVLKFCCNISEISIALSRLIKVKQPKGKFFNLFENFKSKYYILIVFLTSFFISFYKIIQYKIDYGYDGTTYPIDKLFEDSSDYNGIDFEDILVSVFLVINYFIASLLTFLSIILIDIYLLITVKLQNKKKLALNGESSKNFKNLENDCKKREETRVEINGI